MKRNTKKGIIFVIGIMIICSISIIAYELYQNSAGSNKSYRDARVEIAGETIMLDVVQTSSERARGLGGRAELCAQCGMWFIFDDVAQHSFWMKDMQFDIDIIWINDTRVVHSEENVPYATPEKTYGPTAPVSHVLELPAGSVQRLGITTNTTIDPEME